MGDFGLIDVIAREAMLFAGVGLLIGGLDDFAIDLIYLLRRLWTRRRPRTWLTTLPCPKQPGRIVIFVPAWDEVAVIGHMLTNALARFDHANYRIYVGVYPNDQPTIDAAVAVAHGDHRVRIVIGDKPGPTTKADCLNTLWRELLSDERVEGVFAKAVVLHDSEDVVHPAELRIFDTLIEGRAVVQVPVLPLIKHGSRLVSGHYADEFAETNCALPQRRTFDTRWQRIRPTDHLIG
ncbi:glycosyltransferase [Sphingomonas sp. GM_Shp_2]|uniref:glycosyltransferase n=1 Tax=Sphingomonas sp. GM_Shp_2 TaxID=2937380 RepID=UPI00226A0A0C|nr:glycosyltransferase [Sphingomonas sp. GM_Shp_2]